MFLFIAFGAILLVTFGTVTVATTSSRIQRVVERRYLGIRRSADDTVAVSGGNQGPVLLKLAPSSSTEGLDTLLQRFQIIQSLEKKILQADIKGSPSKFIFISVGLAMLGVATISLWFPIFAVQLVVALVFGYMPFGYLTFKRSGRMKKFDTALPDAIDMMARALRAGHAMTAAINIVAEQSQEPVRFRSFGEVFKQQNFESTHP